MPPHQINFENLHLKPFYNENFFNEVNTQDFGCSYLFPKSIIMPGVKCAFPKCSTSRKDKGISLFKIPTPDKTNDESIKWT